MKSYIDNSLNSAKAKVTEAKSFYEKNETYFHAGVFVFGFILDVLLLGPIDDTLTLFQEFLYLLILAFLISYEIRSEVLKKALPNYLAKVWKYHGLVVHFILGSLLNIYTLLFFKSGSLVTSFIFLFIVVALIILNELPRIQNLGSYVRVILFSLCLACFWSIILPLVFGFIGWIPFLLALGVATLVSTSIYKLLNKEPSVSIEPPQTGRFSKYSPLQKHFLFPSLATYSFFFLFYILGFVPPVPLSLEYIGIYHKVEKSGDFYSLSYTRPRWKFWQNGDQTFLAQPGDKIYCFAKIFAPTKFKDQVFLKWFYNDPKYGWQGVDSIPLTVSGGREGGYRGFGVKQNYQPGDWQVRVMSNDEREIGRIHFTVEAEAASDVRHEFIDLH